MRPHLIKSAAKIDQRPHTVNDSIEAASNGLRNLNQMREAFPDAYLEDLPGIGRVWVSEGVASRIVDFDVAPDQGGMLTMVPYAEAGTIRVYAPSHEKGSRLHFHDLRAASPELHSKIVDFLKARLHG